MDEYKILQDKIDKIGGFRFTVKGWSVTITTAALAAAGAAKIPFFLPFVLILLVVVFFLLEHEQWEHSLRFGRRALQIEEALHSLRTDHSFDFAKFRLPAIAFELARRQREITFLQRVRILFRSSLNGRWLIYWVQILSIMIVSAWLFVQSRDTGSSSRTIIPLLPLTDSFKLPPLPFPPRPTFGETGLPRK
jgi:hypothetical protein